MANKTVDSGSRVLLCKDAEGEFKVVIPADSKVTFGPTIPYSPKNGYPGSNHYSLRVYKGSNKENLIAVFAGVERFRDVSLDVQRLVIRESGKTVWKSDETGYKVEENVERQRSWEDELPKLVEVNK